LSASRGEVRRGAFGRDGGLLDLVVGGETALLMRVGGEVEAAGGVFVVADRSVIRSLPTALGFSKVGAAPVPFACISVTLFFLSSSFVT
jgi:hypothetical protein